MVLETNNIGPCQPQPGHSPPAGVGGEAQALAQFLTCIHRNFAHDLCNPLGTVVNYAAVLGGAANGRQRDLANRIARSAHRASRMAQSLARAAGLVVSPSGTDATDLFALAVEVAEELSLPCQVEHLSIGTQLPVTVDPDLLRSVWSAYLAAARGPLESGTPEFLLGVGSDEEGHRVELELWHPAPVDDRSRTALLAVDPEDFLQASREASRLEDAFGLRLAACVVTCRRGTLTLWGTPGSRSKLTLEFPAGWGETKVDTLSHVSASRR